MKLFSMCRTVYTLYKWLESRLFAFISSLNYCNQRTYKLSNPIASTAFTFPWNRSAGSTRKTQQLSWATCQVLSTRWATSTVSPLRETAHWIQPIRWRTPPTTASGSPSPNQIRTSWRPSIDPWSLTIPSMSTIGSSRFSTTFTRSIWRQGSAMPSIGRASGHSVSCGRCGSRRMASPLRRFVKYKLA